MVAEEKGVKTLNTTTSTCDGLEPVATLFAIPSHFHTFINFLIPSLSATLHSMTPLYIFLGIVGLAILSVVAVYNGLIAAKQRLQEAWSDIDVQLKRRYDLIPNLINTVKGYAAHEKGTFDRVIQARNSALNAHGAKEQAQAENMLTGALKSIFALAEAYPDLKANQNFAKLQEELSDTENKIQASRRFYNGMVRDFNIKMEVFPNNVIVGFFKGKFAKQEFFEIEGGRERENIEVKF